LRPRVRLFAVLPAKLTPAARPRPVSQRLQMYTTTRDRGGVPFTPRAAHVGGDLDQAAREIPSVSLPPSCTAGCADGERSERANGPARPGLAPSAGGAQRATAESALAGSPGSTRRRPRLDQPLQINAAHLVELSTLPATRNGCEC
jgi:hypothetical protein